MTKKNKDFFESILSDVVPLKKRKVQLNIKKVEKNRETDFETHDNQQKFLLEPQIKNKEKKLQIIKNEIETSKTTFSKKLKKGKVKIDKKIDLHGYKTHEAEKIFDEKIQEFYNQEKRCILFITGKGLKSRKNENIKEGLYLGKIRAAIANWVKKDNNQQKILYFMQAHSRHGGNGSFYVYLRKKNKS